MSASSTPLHAFAARLDAAQHARQAVKLALLLERGAVLRAHHDVARSAFHRDVNLWTQAMERASRQEPSWMKYCSFACVKAREGRR
jgi:hypothetical protein